MQRKHGGTPDSPLCTKASLMPTQGSSSREIRASYKRPGLPERPGELRVLNRQIGLLNSAGLSGHE